MIKTSYTTLKVRNTRLNNTCLLTFRSMEVSLKLSKDNYYERLFELYTS